MPFLAHVLARVQPQVTRRRVQVRRLVDEAGRAARRAVSMRPGPVEELQARLRRGVGLVEQQHLHAIPELLALPRMVARAP
ncbi:hypothetical protein [Xanthomonas hyacinthi]|uniref:hypothetical protein n=1 Tax=Xanthomonas hyacinthi TaxID=56455 RepID=UPI00062D2A0C|nr:hypothetical protein Y886_10235 [Xanthomonas hyacinthi DSM 19077]